MKRLLNQLFTGLMVVPMLAASLLVFAAPLTYAAKTNGTCDENNISVTEGVDCAKGKDQGTKLFGNGGIFQTVTNVLLFLIGAVSVIMLIVGGLRYVLSGGDSTAVTAAKNTILYAVIGIIVALLAYAIVNFVVTSFVDNGNNANN
jgi:ABC-type Fe3+ transport system permease subunit